MEKKEPPCPPFKYRGKLYTPKRKLRIRGKLFFIVEEWSTRYKAFDTSANQWCSIRVRNANVKHEMHLMQFAKMRNNSVPYSFEHFKDRQNEYLVQEWVDGYDLRYYLKCALKGTSFIDAERSYHLMRGLVYRNILRLLYICIFLYIPAKLARASVPDSNHTESQVVKWWGLINAGFRPIRPQDQYRDPQWHLAGCPWRILVKGDLRIPVFRKRPSKGNSGDRLFKQHYTRMAAYCHLLEKCEHAQSPYGIVLFGNSHKGLTVPSQPGTKKTFHDSLVSARRTIATIPQVLPQHPANTQTCVLCPHSKRDVLTNASICGTRFYWNPPNYKDDYMY
jgi:hypothetical protein